MYKTKSILLSASLTFYFVPCRMKTINFQSKPYFSLCSDDALLLPKCPQPGSFLQSNVQRLQLKNTRPCNLGNLVRIFSTGRYCWKPGKYLASTRPGSISNELIISLQKKIGVWNEGLEANCLSRVGWKNSRLNWLFKLSISIYKKLVELWTVFCSNFAQCTSETK